MNFSTGATLEHQIDTGALLLDLGASNSVSQYYGLSFASGETEEEMLENADSYYVTDEIEISLTYTGDRWYLQPGEELFRILSGNTSYR